MGKCAKKNDDGVCLCVCVRVRACVWCVGDNFRQLMLQVVIVIVIESDVCGKSRTSSLKSPNLDSGKLWYRIGMCREVWDPRQSWLKLSNAVRYRFARRVNLKGVRVFHLYINRPISEQNLTLVRRGLDRRTIGDLRFYSYPPVMQNRFSRRLQSRLRENDLSTFHIRELLVILLVCFWKSLNSCLFLKIDQVEYIFEMFFLCHHTITRAFALGFVVSFVIATT